ncbi:MAG: T9SS type A sorting domain-containing protein, partial [Ignavibacteriae bacterium]|nr:T9SS type A sorting domain-containing protein [Ignavibacteriota bacterium]
HGENWIPAGLNGKRVEALIFKGFYLFAGAYPGVFRSSDFGSNWTIVNNGLYYATAVSLEVYGTNIIAGTASGVFVSTNNGDLWINKNEGFATPPGISTILIVNNYIFVGPYFESVWRRNLSEVIGIKQNSNNIIEKYSLFQNYPNPFNPITIIKFQINLPERTRFTTLKVYNILGKEIATLVNEKLQPGTYEVKFEGTNLPSGVYYYRIETENYSETKKMLMIK